MRLLPSLLVAGKAHEFMNSVHEAHDDPALEEEIEIESSWDPVNEVWIDHDLDQADADLGIELI